MRTLRLALLLGLALLGLPAVCRSQQSRVKISKAGDDIEVRIDDKLFTRYVTKSGPNKPYFYPILTPEGDHLTRRWPMEQVAGESHDHPHHRGLWFTHGSVNGIDFWSEEKNTGKTVNITFGLKGGNENSSGFVAQTEWRGPDDKLIATDTRHFTFFALPNGDRLMDFMIVIKPNGAPLVFGDTKEGMFGLRLPDALAPAQKKGGHSVNAEGLTDAALWGKPSNWVDFWGTIGGQTYGVAIFDHPQNIRHPQTWHARDYGLFAVNPFGLHDFGQGAKGAGDFTVPANKRLILRYRLLFHKGDAKTARIAEQYTDYYYGKAVR